MKGVISKLQLFMLAVMLMMSFTTTVFATDLDKLNDGQNTTEQSQQSDGHNDSVTDYMRNYKPVTDENMQNATQYASPITNAIGTFVGFVVMCVSAGIFAVTALDLAYIGLPVTRSFLNPQQAQQQGGGMSGFGGMGSMGGAQQQTQEYGLHRKWVSDEAVACVAQASPQQQQGGFGGGFGGSGFSAMGGAQQQQPQQTKSVISMYLKKRIVFLVVFAIATVLLTSSIFTDCGINLAQLMFKIMDKVNGTIAGVQV